jgi:hypothetical protein
LETLEEGEDLPVDHYSGILNFVNQFSSEVRSESGSFFWSHQLPDFVVQAQLLDHVWISRELAHEFGFVYGIPWDVEGAYVLVF